MKLQHKNLNSMKRKFLLSLAIAFGMAGSVWADLTKVDGVYQIGSAQDLVAFATLVNGGTTVANAVLTADIDLSGKTWTPIGNSTNKYAGTFDGQGHAITNFSYTATGDYNGLFGYINNATVKNFSISGILTSGFSKNGVVGNVKGTSTVSRIHSSLTINVSECKGHTGGIVGGDEGATTDKPVVEYCEYSGTLTHSGTGDCQAGILGYTGYGTVRNCIFSGTISGESSRYAGILGYCKQPSFGGVQNCLSIGKIVVSSDNIYKGAIIGTWNGGATENVKNNYYCLKEGSNITRAIGGNTSNCKAPILVTAEQLASGEICYKLNGNTSNGVWHQTLPASPSGDAAPTLDSTHGVVYVNGTVCPDTNVPQGTVSYSNTDGTNVGEHNYDGGNGFCIYCDTFNPDAFSPVDGYYQIANGIQLRWFAAKVNSGTYNAKAKLTADIDMTGVDISYFPIGDASATNKYYTGIFDGQGHKLSNFQLVNTFAATNFGMFNVTTGVVLKNFWLDNSCAIEGQEMVGLIGHLYGGGTLEGIGNCANVTGIQNNIGGLIGGVTGKSGDKKNITIKNCWTTGTVETTNPSASKGKDCGALTGWFNNANITIDGFWTVADVVNPTSSDKYVYRNGGGASFTISKCFSKNGTQINYPNFTDAQLANGWLCYNLGSDWYQTIGSDNYPVLDSTHGVVGKIADCGYGTLYAADTDVTIPSGITAYAGKNNGTSIKLTAIADKIKAGEAVVLVGDEGFYSFMPTTGASDVEENDLEGSDETVTTDDSYIVYALANKTNGVGFYKVNAGVKVPAGRAYFKVSTGASAKAFYLFGEDDATSLSEELRVKSEESDAAIYNLSGQRISKLQKGFNIVNGKKVLF